MDSFDVNLAQQLQTLGARTAPGDVVMVRPGIAFALRQTSGNARHHAAAAALAAAEAAAAVDRIRQNKDLSATGAAKAITREAREPALRKLAEARARAAVELGNAEARLEHLAGPVRFEPGSALDSFAREVRQAARTLPVEQVLAAAADPEMARALLGGPRIGIPAAALDVARQTVRQGLEASPDYMAAAEQAQHLREALAVADDAQRALDQIAPPAGAPAAPAAA